MGYRRLEIGFVFVKYDLFYTTTFIHYCIYMNFRIHLTQFYINFWRQEHQRDDLLVDRSTPEILRFHPIPPLIFP